MVVSFVYGKDLVDVLFWNCAISLPWTLDIVDFQQIHDFSR